MKASPASTLRNLDSMVRIKSPHMGERKTMHVLYIVFPDLCLQPQGKDEFPRRTLLEFSVNTA